MRVVLQRVRRASVRVDGVVVGAIDRGLLALVGVGQDSAEADAAWLAAKTAAMRLFPAPKGDAGKMEASVADIGGAVLAISQFTLYADVRRGRRPSFVAAAPPGRAEALYEAYCDGLDVGVARGRFGAPMQIDLEADGPVTITMERCDGMSIT